VIKWTPEMIAQPRSSAEASGPSGEVERWLVAHASDYRVICVVWERGWFAARERAEWYLKIRRDDLLLVPMPLWPEEKTLEHPWSAVMLAERLGFTMYEGVTGTRGQE